MKIETLTNLVNGELLNSPYISEVVHFTDKVDEVNRGSCFFAREVKDIVFAIKNGAYAIVVDKDVDILDNEIAWIKVEDFKKAINSIFKYENLENRIYKINKIEAMLIRKINSDKRVVIVEDDIFRAINLREKFLFSQNEYANSVNLPKSECDLKKLDLFKSEYEEIELNLAYVYKKEFCNIINFFKQNSLKFNLDFEFERFKPIFVDNLFREVGYGESERVVILNLENDQFLFREINYIVSNTKHAKTVFIDRYNLELLKKGFNFAVMVGVEFSPNEFEEGELFD